MQKTFRIAVLAILAFAVVGTAMADDARKAKILENLKLKFPQLAEMNVTMGELGASDYAGLDKGNFVIPGRGEQQFFVTSDDKQLWMVNEPIDVSRSADEIKAEVAKLKAAEAEKAKEVRAQLEEAIKGLPTRGPADAPVTIVEFSDFQCPYCSRGAATVEEILEKYEGDVKFVFKHFPLNFHPWAKPASIAAHCAGQQKADAFWTLHDQFFANQREMTPENVVAKSKEFLAGSGVDLEKWATCAENQKSEEYTAAAAAVDADMALGQSLGVSGTPGFFVNGQFLNGAQPITAFEPLIEAAKGGA